MYILRQPASVCTVFQHNDRCIHQWHRKMEDRDPEAIRTMYSKNLVKELEIVDCSIKETCDTCMKKKMTRLPFPKYSKSESSAPLDLIHTNVCGLMQTQTPSGKRYLVSFIDNYSSFTFICLLAHKSEVEKTLKQFIEFCKTKYGCKPKTIRSDRGREYTGRNITDLLKYEDIKIQLTAAFSPQQNGKAKRKNRTLIKMARCMLVDTDLPNIF